MLLVLVISNLFDLELSIHGSLQHEKYLVGSAHPTSYKLYVDFYSQFSILNY
jgi:hypothetical protein